MKKAEKEQKVFDDCYAIYEKSGGYTAVFDHVAKEKANNNPTYKDVTEERCDACDNDMPSLNNTCLICGQPIDSNQKLINAVIEDLKKSFEYGDYTVLDELLHFIPKENLIQALPEEKWEKYK